MSYLVIRLDGGPHPPRVKHVNIEDAEEEAGRLAAKHPGSCFVCAEIICAYQTHPIPRKLSKFDVPLIFKPE